MVSKLRPVVPPNANCMLPDYKLALYVSGGVETKFWTCAPAIEAPLIAAI